MNGILLPGNSLKFPLVKIIVSKIAYKSLKTTKNSHFLGTDHQNVVHENFFRDFGDIICIKNLFRPISNVAHKHFFISLRPIFYSNDKSQKELFIKYLEKSPPAASCHKNFPM